METVTHEGKEYVIAATLAKARGVTRVAIYRAIDQGRLSSVEVLGRRLVPAGEAELWFPSASGGARSGAGRPKKKVEGETNE